MLKLSGQCLLRIIYVSRTHDSKNKFVECNIALLRCFECGQLWASRYYYLEAWHRRPSVVADVCGQLVRPFKGVTFN